MSASVDRAISRIGESIHPGNAELLGLAPGVEVRPFVSKDCGARGFSTGTARFQPGAFLAYHTNTFSEAITVLSGEAVVAVHGRTYVLSLFDCIYVPAGVAHCSKRLNLLRTWKRLFRRLAWTSLG